MNTCTSIRKFYEAQHVLVTGATGFLGIVLVEKLLRSFPGVEKIYAIVRTRSGESLDDRKQLFFNEKIFSQIEQHDRDKVVFIEGDLEKSRMGLSEKDIDLFMDTVDLVFHCAATVKFTERLDKAVQKNIIGTQELLEIFEHSKKLKCFMHVSTIFVNFDTKISLSEERVYPAKYTVDELIRLANCNPQDKAKAKCLLGDFPNTYILTKTIAEHAILERAGRWPAGIFRAPILTATCAEPFAYYSNNMSMTRVLQYLREGFEYDVDFELNSNSSPVDVAVCALIAAARDSVRCYNDKVKVYNCTNYSGRCTYGEVTKWYVGNGSRSKVENTEAEILESKLLKKYLGVFMNTYFECPNTNVEKMWMNMTATDRQLIPFDFNAINWNKYYSQMHENLVYKQM